MYNYICVLILFFPPHVPPGKFKGYGGAEEQLSLNDLSSLLNSVDHQQVIEGGETVISDAALAALLDRSFATERKTSEPGGDSGAAEEHASTFKVLEERSTVGSLLDQSQDDCVVGTEPVVASSQATTDEQNGVCGAKPSSSDNSCTDSGVASALTSPTIEADMSEFPPTSTVLATLDCAKDEEMNAICTGGSECGRSGADQVPTSPDGSGSTTVEAADASSCSGGCSSVSAEHSDNAGCTLSCDGGAVECDGGLVDPDAVESEKTTRTSSASEVPVTEACAAEPTVQEDARDEMEYSSAESQVEPVLPESSAGELPQVQQQSTCACKADLTVSCSTAVEAVGVDCSAGSGLAVGGCGSLPGVGIKSTHEG